MNFSGIERGTMDLSATAADRLRAIGLRLRGAQLGPKCRIGAACRIVRPWLLAAGERVTLEHLVYLKITDEAASVRLGARTFIGFAAELDIASSLEVGDDVLIAPGCFITDHNHRHARAMLVSAQGVESAPVRIADGAWLGAHAVVLPGVTIGAGAIVAAGAVVTRDVAPHAIVAGVPARPIGERA